MDEPLQKSLERYDVLDRIAVGGMAEVFIAKAYGAHGFEKTLAIKRILPELARDPEFEARFIAEAKVAVRLSHANIVQVFDFGRIGESLFIAMEFVDGLDLAAMLRKFKDEGRHVPLPAAFHIAIEIVRALDFAHGHNVVHRDVSPSNILISRAGEVKIADFGIAVAAQPHRNSGPGPRRVMGKWRYMSPEQTRGDTLDTRSDMFSAASCIYELFTNEKLFPGDEAEDIIKNIADMPIPRMTSLRPGLPSRLDEVLAGPLSRKPIDRPTRPASTLRSLIELSYESSIMATALDVAEALASVIPAPRMSGRGALDDVIRRQLADQSVARRTAVTDKPPGSGALEQTFDHEHEPTGVEPAGASTTGLFRKVDIDGLSRLEEVEVNTRVAPVRPREVAIGFPMPGDSDIGALPRDKDRHTEVGGPPTGQVPKDIVLGDSARKLPAVAAASRRRSRRLQWAAIAAIALAAGGAGVWALTRPDPPARVPIAVPPPPVVIDAPVVDEMGTLEIDSLPTGAMVTIAGQHPARAPRSARVTSGEKVLLRFELPGYLPAEEEYVAQPGKTLVIKQRLVAAPAVLEVETTPPGAQVWIAGQIAGTTPLSTTAPPRTGAEIRLTKLGFEPVTVRADLVSGETASIKRELRETQKFGTVAFALAEGTTAIGWFNVYANGKNLGRNKTLNALTRYRFPIGKHQIRLVTATGKAKAITVEVGDKSDQTIPVKFE